MIEWVTRHEGKLIVLALVLSATSIILKLLGA